MEEKDLSVTKIEKIDGNMSILFQEDFFEKFDIKDGDFLSFQKTEEDNVFRVVKIRN